MDHGVVCEGPVEDPEECMRNYDFTTLLQAWENYQTAKALHKEAQDHLWDHDHMPEVVSDRLKEVLETGGDLEQAFRTYVRSVA